MFKIDKTFEFCYGHRVWTQTLDGRFADDLQCACRHLHGHEAKVQVFMESEDLNPQGMVTDFRHLEWFKKWVNIYLDHRFVMHLDDPLLGLLVPPDLNREPVYVDTVLAGYTLSGYENRPSHEQEQLEGMFLTTFVPTSENFSRWVHGLVQEKMKPLGVTVSQVDWWETPKSRSSYVTRI